MTKTTLETFQETREQLQAALANLKELEGLIFSGDRAELARVELKMEEIRALKEKFIEQREALSTVLPDGSKLWPDQYQALERFASNNKLDVKLVLSGITIKDGVVVECDFQNKGLTTLEGLESLRSMKKLNVGYNRRLTSLKGLPRGSIEVIDARDCGLTGDLAELSGADKLKRLIVCGNKGLTSFKGLPTGAIEVIDAYRCGLTGDLSELSGADKLKELDVGENEGITSLKGLPTMAIEFIDACGCGLIGDLAELIGADKLKVLRVSANKGLTSLRGLPTKEIREIFAAGCGLTGDLAELRGADQLETLCVNHVGGLTSLEGIPMKSIKNILASECDLTGDHTFLSQAPHLQLLNVEWNPKLSLHHGNFHGSVQIKTTRPYWDTML